MFAHLSQTILASAAVATTNDSTDLLESFGYIGIFLILFAESGLFVGFFLPGDSLLFTAGFLAAQGIFSLPVLIGLCFAAAVMGDSFGYWCGAKFGPRLLSGRTPRFVPQAQIVRATAIFARYGGKALVLARFMGIIRAFAPIVAGVSAMPYRTFLTFNLIGAFGWTVSVSVLGYFLGSTIPNVDSYMLPVMAVIGLITLVSMVNHLRHAKPQPQIA